MLHLHRVLLAGANDVGQLGEVEGVLVPGDKVFCSIRNSRGLDGKSVPVVDKLAGDHGWVFPLYRQAVWGPGFQGQAGRRFWSGLEDNGLSIRHSFESLKDTDGADGHGDVCGSREGIEEEVCDRRSSLMLHCQVPFHLQVVVGGGWWPQGFYCLAISPLVFYHFFIWAGA